MCGELLPDNRMKSTLAVILGMLGSASSRWTESGQDGKSQDVAELFAKVLTQTGEEYRATRLKILAEGEQAAKFVRTKLDNSNPGIEAALAKVLLDRLNRPDYYKGLEAELVKAAQDKSRRPNLGMLQKLLLNEHPDAEGQRACVLEILEKRLLPETFSLGGRGFRTSFVEGLYRFVFAEAKADGTGMQRTCHQFAQRLLNKSEDTNELSLAISHFGLQANAESLKLVVRIIREDRRENARKIGLSTAANRIMDLQHEEKKNKEDLLNLLLEVMQGDASPSIRAYAASSIDIIAMHRPSQAAPGDNLQTLGNSMGQDVSRRVQDLVRTRLAQEKESEVLLALFDLLYTAGWPVEVRHVRASTLYTLWSFPEGAGGNRTSEEDFRDLLEAIDADKESPEWRMAAIFTSVEGILFLRKGGQLERKRKLVDALLGRLTKEREANVRLALIEGLRLFGSSGQYENVESLAQSLGSDLKATCRAAFRKRLDVTSDKSERETLEALLKLYK
jgi:hypothetical protein